ncbi:MAG: lipopolysaccharide biosynthesis protein [Chitinophagaceae bacterium]|nr:lipopolysaccharide biosynthesis protein [Chitinophagaceae bacterium]
MSEQKNGKEISLIELFIKLKESGSYLISRWKIIILTGMLGGLLGLGLAFLSKPTYTASLTFALEDEEGGGMSGALGLASQLGFDLGVHGGGAFVGSNLIELFKSRTMVEKALLSPITINGETVSFAEMYIRDFGWREQWVKKGTGNGMLFLPNSNRGKFSREQDSILGKIFTNLSTNCLNVSQKNKDVEIIAIEMKSGNESFAKYFTEALAKEVSEFYISTRNQKAKTNLEILEKQTDSIRGELNSSIMGVAVSNDNTFNLNPALNVRRVPSSQKQVDVQANATMLVELVKQTELAKVTLRRETPLIQVIDYPVLPLKKEKLGKLKGIVIVGFIASFITILVLLIKRFVKKHLS